MPRLATSAGKPAWTRRCDGAKHRGGVGWGGMGSEERGDRRQGRRTKASSEDRLPKEERYLAPPGAPSYPALAPGVRKLGMRTTPLPSSPSLVLGPCLLQGMSRRCEMSTVFTAFCRSFFPALCPHARLGPMSAV